MEEYLIAKQIPALAAAGTLAIKLEGAVLTMMGNHIKGSEHDNVKALLPMPGTPKIRLTNNSVTNPRTFTRPNASPFLPNF